MPPPEYYDDWDPEAHDREAERIQERFVELWNADLRNLRSEVEAEQDEARWAAKPDRFDYRSIRDAFEADNPEPDRDDFEARADWQWRWLEHWHTETGYAELLHRHRMERRSYVQRHAASLRRAREWADELFRPLRERPHNPNGWEPIPWPVGDGVTGWRTCFEESGAFEGLADGALNEPSVDAAIDLEAGVLGWFQSLYEDEREPSELFRKALREAESLIKRSYKAEYLPGCIGRDQLHLRRAILHCEDALDMLDGFRGYDWLTSEAHDRLRELIEVTRDTATDRYALLRELYDAYRQRAIHLLRPQGTEGKPVRLDPHPLLPERYERFDPRAHENEHGELCMTELYHSQDDLRDLQSEVEAERIQASQDARPSEYDYRAIQAAFAEANPEPSHSEPDAHAEWEWRRLEHFYEATDSDLLHRHRMERGAYIARHAEWLWDTKRRLERARQTPRKPASAQPQPRPTWPVGDGISAYRKTDPSDFDFDEDQEGALDEPSYNCALDLSAATVGWTISLENDQYHVASAAIDTLHQAATKVEVSYRADYRPGTVGKAQLDLRHGILACDDALALLDGLRGYEWYSEAADTRLRELVDVLRDAATERYVELRALYDAYRERAIRILGPEGVAGL